MTIDMDELISIIVPVYNAEKFVERCIDSLISQEYANIQIILVDDGSKDASLSICRRKATGDKRILVLHQENSGVSSARNYGLSQAEGEYIAFCDSDDLFLPKLLSKLYSNMIQSEADLSCCSYMRVPSLEDIDFKTVITSEKIVLEQKVAVARMIMEADGYLWNKLFKRSLIGNNTFPEDIAILEDEVFVLNYMKMCNKAVFDTEPLYVYWDNPESAVNRNKITNRKLTDIVARERIIDVLKEMGIDENTIRFMWNELIKSYAISFKKLLLVNGKEIAHWKTYVLRGYNKRKHEYSRDESWSKKELIYLLILGVFSFFVR